MKLEMFDILSWAAVIAYFIPMIIVLFKKLWNDKFFMLFASYWAYGGLINVTDFIPGFPAQASNILGMLYNIFDAPIILSIFYTTTKSLWLRKFCIAGIILALSSAIIGIVIGGFTYDALKYSLGISVALVLIAVIQEIISYMQQMEHSNRQNAKIFVYAGLLFEYATFIIIYLFDYVFIDDYNKKHNFMIYYASSLVALFIASCGFILFKRYEKKYSRVMD
jgi:hypothetical protein